jgi:hypothetical protein
MGRRQESRIVADDQGELCLSVVACDSAAKGCADHRIGGWGWLTSTGLGFSRRSRNLTSSRASPNRSHRIGPGRTREGDSTRSYSLYWHGPDVTCRGGHRRLMTSYVAVAV